MTSDRTPIIDLDTYRQYPIHPDDVPVAEPEDEQVDWHPEDQLDGYDEQLLAEIAFLRETVADLTARSNRRYDRADLALVAMLGILGTVLAILLFGPA